MFLFDLTHSLNGSEHSQSQLTRSKQPLILILSSEQKTQPNNHAYLAVHRAYPDTHTCTQKWRTATTTVIRKNVTSSVEREVTTLIDLVAVTTVIDEGGEKIITIREDEAVMSMRMIEKGGGFHHQVVVSGVHLRLKEVDGKDG